MSRYTGFSPKVRDMVLERSGGSCECCRGPFDLYSALHHRRPRGAGGSRDPLVSSAANALALCGRCHAHAESHRDLARQQGLLVSQWADPAEVPVFLRGVLVVLGVDGSVIPWRVAS